MADWDLEATQLERNRRHFGWARQRAVASYDFMELRVIPNKHGYLVTGKEAGQSTEEQAVFRTMQDLDRALRAAGVNAETISRMGRRLERGEGFLVEESRLATEHLFPQHRRL